MSDETKDNGELEQQRVKLIGYPGSLIKQKAKQRNVPVWLYRSIALQAGLEAIEDDDVFYAQLKRFNEQLGKRRAGQ